MDYCALAYCDMEMRTQLIKRRTVFLSRHTQLGQICLYIVAGVSYALRASYMVPKFGLRGLSPLTNHKAFNCTVVSLVQAKHRLIKQIDGLNM
jgi:hypothetical protein